MKELGHFLHAVRFLTVARVPSTAAIDPDWLPRSAKYFPLVGALVGALSAAVLLLANEIWTGMLPALLAVATSVLVTGALHEDGLADTADGLGGGGTPEARLTIMKDSRLGTYGALALGFSMAFRIGALAVLPPFAAAAALLAAHAGARSAATAVMIVQPYARDISSGKVMYSSDRPRASEFLFGVILAVLAATPIALITPFAVVPAVILGAVLAAWLSQIAGRLVGGYTGDVLGAVEQLFEVSFLIAIAAVMQA